MLASLLHFRAISSVTWSLTVIRLIKSLKVSHTLWLRVWGATSKWNINRGKCASCCCSCCSCWSLLRVLLNGVTQDFGVKFFSFIWILIRRASGPAPWISHGIFSCADSSFLDPAADSRVVKLVKNAFYVTFRNLKPQNDWEWLAFGL